MGSILSFKETRVVQNFESDPETQSPGTQTKIFSSEQAFDEWMKEERKTLKWVKMRTYSPKSQSNV